MATGQGDYIHCRAQQDPKACNLHMAALTECAPAQQVVHRHSGQCADSYHALADLLVSGILGIQVLSSGCQPASKGLLRQRRARVQDIRRG